ncbi:uncharacterized protein LOC113347202 [Papaver somniferum]|uniref:uncharacterized protein LOC113347202 n=1 Tax=Papaver somniferum TaxID=3469 RepID=UPI000E6F5D32|nr:uncharacterized protein LOC113347202 [Papaver somniferum]
MDQLFLQCHVSKKVWDSIQTNIVGSVNGLSMYDWICSWFTNGSNAGCKQDFIEIAGYTLWHIWKTRSDVVFDSAKIHLETLVRQIKQSISEWNGHAGLKLTRGINNNSHMIPIPWIPPANTFSKINFDGSICKNTHTMGSGLVCMDDAGNFKSARCIPGVAEDEEKAEAIAALEAIKWATEQHIGRLHLEGDYLNAINGSLGSVQWTTNAIIRDCLALLRDFNGWVYAHVPRETNDVADTLAKDARHISSSVSWNLDCPLWLKSLFQERLNMYSA